MQDVVPPSDRSIRNIPLPAHRRRPAPDGLHTVVPPPPPPRHIESPQNEDFYDEEPKRGASRALWVVVVLVLGALIAIAAAMFFSGATVTVQPRKDTVELPASLSAMREAPIGTLPFQTVKTEDMGSREVAATGEQEVKRQSSGTITVSNAYSTAPQRLIKNTRFEAPDGKIYRINESIDVPGGKAAAQGAITPGTIDVVVYADSAGPAYDRSGLDTFTIPGFKGDPRYTKFTAKAKTPITGGFVGKEKVIATADRQAAEAGIKAELTEKLAKALLDATPQDSMLVADSISYAFLPVADDSASGDSARVILKGVAVGAIVKETELAAAIARTTIDGYGGEAVRFADRTAVAIKAKEPTFEGAATLLLAGSGATDLVWQFDPEAVRRALVGQSEDAFVATLTGLGPAIADGVATIRPFWKHSFPSDISDITVKTGTPVEARR